ncbi:MAG: nucleotidyltransferase, partial [Flavobacteriales bacterium]
IGIYAFKDGGRLKGELQHLIDNNVIKGGEYQLPDALRNMTQDGLQFIPGEVSEWMDCGNKRVTVDTNTRILQILEEEGRLDAVPNSAKVTDSVILQPCHIGEGVVLERAVVGPNVTLGAGTTVRDARVSNALVAGDSLLEHCVVDGAMVGAHAAWHGTPADASIGDYSTLGNPRG